jgi:hypothetical protein
MENVYDFVDEVGEEEAPNIPTSTTYFVYCILADNFFNCWAVRTVVLSGWLLYWVVILSQALFFRSTETASVFLFSIAFPISRMKEATRIFSFKLYAVSILQENSKQAVTRCMV